MMVRLTKGFVELVKYDGGYDVLSVVETTIFST